MEKLDRLASIGFYTLSDERARTSSMVSPLYRCELLLTDRCNFHCLYCRGLKNGRDLNFKDAKRILKYWISEGLKNIRFSGGEPTLYPHLFELVDICKKAKVKHIAISTNGSSSRNYYLELVKRGVKEVGKGIRKGHKGLVIFAADVSPPDVLSHLPI